MQEALDPVGKRAPHRLLLRIAQERVERLDNAPQLVWRAPVLEPEERLDRVAHTGCRMQSQARLVDQMIGEVRLVVGQAGWWRDKEIAHIGRCAPHRLAVVENDWQDGRQFAIAQFAPPDQILRQQSGIDQHAQRHPAVGFRLKLEHQVDPQPAIAQTQAPDHVVVAFLLVLGHVARVHPLQRREVRLSQPVARNPVTQQIAHHFRVGEE